ncbi:DUF11 domain-containing protein [Sphingomonas mollis]|uniref:DUF11 domain-containing protein n=1 Tax=Sphingomonas mollis TaxID=2795726 RepID=A0ABS0XQN8_9SPHN|nr:DUF11 domain-containing protein [Sphingomonas sp. BT553]MBJ6122100.1 DUF11 domain-containing protein [Sphingomonas sp. BT553]
MTPLFLLPLAAAVAATPAPLSLETKVLAETRVAAADGTTRIALVAPRRIVPGDQVVVQVVYRNAGRQPIDGLVIANPLPQGLAYRDAGAASAAPELSVDGRTFGTLATLRVPVAAGGTRPAGVGDVTHVRWRVPNPVAAGSSGQFAFRAIVR